MFLKPLELVLVLVARKTGNLPFFVFAFRFFRQQRTAELHFGEAETVAQRVRRSAQFFQLSAALRVQQVQLLVAVRQPAERHAQEANFAFYISMRAKQRQKLRESVGVELDGIGRRDSGDGAGAESSRLRPHDLSGF